MDKSLKRALSGMFVLAAGASGAKLITFASLPAITRLYTPADIGLLSLFSALVMLLCPLITFQYERALPLPDRDSTAINILALAVLLALSMVGVATALLAIAGAKILPVFSMEALLPFWWVLPLGCGVYATYRIMLLWSTRNRRYRVMSRAEVFQSASGNAVKVVVGFSVASALGLLIGHMIALGGGVVTHFLDGRAKMRSLLRFVSMRRIRVVGVRYLRFPKFRMPSQLTLMAASQSPVLFIGANYGAAVAGQFGLAMMALSFPVNMLARTMSNAYYGEIAKLGAQAGSQIRASAIGVTKLFSAVGLAFALGVYFLAPIVFPIVFGSEWTIAGEYAAILSIYVAFQFIVVPVMNVLSVFGREDVYLALNIQRLVLVVLLFGFSVYAKLSIEQVLYGYTIVMVLHYIVSVWRVFSIVPTGEER